MKLSLKDAYKISKLYNLGKVRKTKLIKNGLVNYNFILETEKGEFIVRFLGHKLDKYKKQRLMLESKVLNYLKNRNFPYQTPIPIKNKKGKYLSNINNRAFWIYKKIEGDSFKGKINDEMIKEIAKALATYHKYIKNLKINKKDPYIFSIDWIIKRYSKLKKIKIKNKEDKLFADNSRFFSECLDKINKMNFKTNLTITHSDFQKDNLLFRKNKVVAILDFDNLEIAPRINEIAYSIKNFKKEKQKVFLKEYEKINPLSKKEKAMIIPLIIRNNCITFWWFYAGMKKRKNRRCNLMNYNIKMTRDLVKEIGWLK